MNIFLCNMFLFYIKTDLTTLTILTPCHDCTIVIETNALKVVWEYNLKMIAIVHTLPKRSI